MIRQSRTILDPRKPWPFGQRKVKRVTRRQQQRADAKGDRCAVVLERTAPHGYLRIEFYGDAKGHSSLVHPESLVMVHQSDHS